jgi:hypothetical protein
VVQGDIELEGTLLQVWNNLGTQVSSKCGFKWRLRDTRIFLLGVALDGRLVVEIPPLPISLQNLAMVNKMAKGRQYDSILDKCKMRMR